MTDYIMYYKPSLSFYNQNTEVFKYGGMDFYRYFHFKFSTYKPDKSRIPAVTLEIIILGLCLNFSTHRRK